MKNWVPAVLLLLAVGANGMAGSHTWKINELFSNADGSIWFIEFAELVGAGTENSVGSTPLSTLSPPADMFTICIRSDDPPAGCNVNGNTAFKSILFGNAGYRELAAAQGAPPADQVVSISAFFDASGDTLRYNTGPPTYDQWAFGTVPADGTNSLNRTAGVAPNTPKNYLGATGSIDASSPPPAMVPDRAAAGVPMTVEKLDPSGSSLRVSWDVDTCVLNFNHNIIFGERSDLPASTVGVFALAGSVCGLGGASPFTWNATPNAQDGSGLIWWLIVVSNEPTVEGSWGENSAGVERAGSGPAGSSLECGVSQKSLSNSCGRLQGECAGPDPSAGHCTSNEECFPGVCDFSGCTPRSCYCNLDGQWICTNDCLGHCV